MTYTTHSGPTAHGTEVSFGAGDRSSVITPAGRILPVDDSATDITQPGRTYDK